MGFAEPSQATDLAFDSNGNLYVTGSDGGTSDGSVSVFAPGATSPFTTILRLNSPTSLAFDIRGNLYVANGSGSVSVFAVGLGAPTATISGLNSPTSLAFDPRGNLYIIDAPSVSVFGPTLAAGGVVIRAGQSDLPINLGSGSFPGSGLSLTTAELAQIYTVAAGTLTVGDLSQTGEIGFGNVSPAVPGTDLVAIQSPTGPGAIDLLFQGGQPAIDVGSGDIHLSAGTGGIVGLGDGSTATFVSTGQVTLDTFGGIGSGSGSLVFDAAESPAAVTVGEINAPTLAVNLSGMGALTLAGVHTADAPFSATADTDLTVAPFAVVDTGTGTLNLTAAADIFGGANLGGGVLTIAAGAAIVSANSGEEAITLSGDDIEINAGDFPATVGLSHVMGQPPVPVAGGVVIENSQTSQPILIGDDSGTGLSLSDAELKRIFTVATGTVTFGDPFQTGNITFSGASPDTTPGASVTAVQSPTGGGAIILDSTAGTALSVATGDIELSAGTGGITAAGGREPGHHRAGHPRHGRRHRYGSARIVFDAAAAPDALTIGDTIPPGMGAYLSGRGSLALGAVATANSPLDVTTALDLTVNAGVMLQTGTGTLTLAAAGNLTVGPYAVVDTGTGTLTLAAASNPDGTSSNAGVLTIAAGAEVDSENTGAGAITLSGTDINIATGVNSANVGAHRTVWSPISTLTEQDGPSALAFDSKGNLYVADMGIDTVSVFAPNSTTRMSRLIGVDGPSALAFDGSGRLYVANTGGSASTVSVFDPNATVPDSNSTLTGLDDPVALAFGRGGYLYVANYGGGTGTTVSVFARGAPPHLNAHRLERADALAFDAKGNLYVANAESNTVSVFNLNGPTPSSTLTGPLAPQALAIGPDGSVYVGNVNTVSVFAPGSTTLTSTLVGVRDPDALLFDARGNLYVANNGSGNGTTVSAFHWAVRSPP